MRQTLSSLRSLMQMRTGGLMQRSERKPNSGWRPIAVVDEAALVGEVGLLVADLVVDVATRRVRKGPN